MKKIVVIVIIFCSCNNSTKTDCTKVNLSETDFIKIGFTSLPQEVQKTIINLATINKTIDTVFSLQKEVTYNYNNPGDNKGYIDQVIKDKDMHLINGKCYQFLLYDKPYIIYNDNIYCFLNSLGANCSNPPCVPDTSGINQETIMILPLSKILNTH